MVRKVKGGSGQSESSQKAKDETFEEDDPGDELTIEVSCTPCGSRLKKPTDFFRSAFANFAKPYVKGFVVKSVSHLKDDIFLVRTSMENVDVIQKIATHSDLTHALKKITIVNFPKSISSVSREDNSKWSPAQADSVQSSQLAKELKYDEEDFGKELDKEETLSMQVLCIPNGSKLRKPTDFFNSAFASITKPYRTTFDVKSVIYVKDNIFLVKTSMEYIDVIQKIAKCNDIEYAGKNLKIIAFSNSASSKSRKGSSKSYQRQSALLMEKELKPNASSLNNHEYSTSEHRESANSDSKKGMVVKTCGNTDDFERNDGLDKFGIESIDVSARPQTITCLNSQDAKGATRKRAHNMENKKAFGMTSVRRMSNGKMDFFPPEFITEYGNKVEIYGDVGDVGRDTLGIYLESKIRSGGGDIKEADLEGDPPFVVFDDPEAAVRVVERGTHMLNKKKFHFKFPFVVKEKLNNEKDSAPCKILSEDCENILELHGDVNGLGKESLEMYLENEKRSGGGEIKEMNMGANPPWVTFLESKAKDRVIKRGVHTLDGKKFHLKVPEMKKEKEEKDCSLSNISSPGIENLVEIHGDVAGLGEDSLEMYLENTKRSGGGEIKEMNMGANPPWVVFHESEAKERVIERGMHTIDGKEFHLKAPVLKKEEKEEDSRSPNMLNSECQNVVEIHGNVEGLGKDSLEMYLESKKRSGGGEIQELKLDSSPPSVVFCENEVARRVVEKGLHVLDEKEFFLKYHVGKKEKMNDEKDNISCEHVVEILGDITGLGKDSLEMYLENKKRSGGGEIKEMNMGANPPWVVFLDSKAKERVIEKGVHTLDGKKFYLKVPVLKKEEEEKDCGSLSISKPVIENLVEIHGDLTGLGKESLEMYLESKKRSGGGEIKEMNMSANPPWVAFLESEAKKRVVERSVHSVDGKEFYLKAPVTKKEKKENDSQLPSMSSVESKNIVEIHGDITGLGKDSLELYLENEKRSGGGEIKDINMEANPPLVIFCDCEAATRVVKKGEHTLSGVKFQLKRPIVMSYRDDVILLCNVEQNTSNDSLTMYVEKLCGSSPEKIEYNYDKSVVMATIPCKVDWTQVIEAHSKKPTLDGARITFEKVPVCTTAVISNIPETVSTDYLQLLIEKYCGNDSVAGLEYVKGQQHASIRFHSLKALQSLLKQKVVIEGENVDVEEYNPSFITEHILKMMKKEPSEILINVDGLIMEHLMKNHKADLCQHVGSEVYTKGTPSNDSCVQVQACFSRCPDIPNQSEIFQSYYNDFISKEASVDVKDRRVLDLAKSLNVTVRVNSPGNGVIVIGRKLGVEEFLDAADNSSHIETDIELPPEKIKLLKSAGSLAELEKNFSVKIETDREKLRVVGPEAKIARLEARLNLKMQNITSSSVSITDSIWKCLQKQEIFLEISSLMERHGVICNVSDVGNTVNLIAMSQKDLSNGIERFKQTVVEEQVPMSENEASFVMGKKGSEIIAKLLLSRRFMLSERGKRNFKFTGLADECFAAKDELTKVLKENAFQTKFLPFSLGKTKAVLTICKESIDKLLNDKRNHQIIVNKSEDRCSIKVTGYGKAVGYVAHQIEAVAEVIKRKDLVFERPGLSKVIELESSQQVINSLEKDKKVVIIRKERDIKGTIPREDIEREYDIIPDLSSSTLICKYQRGGDMSLSVYKGDITKHKADVIVNPANGNLLLGGGVAGAILSAGGSSVQDECNRYVREHGGSLREGEVATTGAGKLTCRRIIHAVGPQWQSNTRAIGEQELKQNRQMSLEALAEVMVNVLQEADKEECRVLAVPAISSGIFGFPKDLCADILIKTAVDRIDNGSFHNLKEVHFVNNDDPTVQVFCEKFTASFGMQTGFKRYMSAEDAKDSLVKSVRKRPAAHEKYTAHGSRQQLPPDEISKQKIEVASSSSTNSIDIELVIDDLGNVKADVIVNSTSPDLDLSKNPCANSLSKAAGQSLQTECTAWVESHSQLPAYSFVETKGGQLKCKKVLHAVCQQYNGQDSENKLKKLIAKIFDAANKAGLKSVAMPGLGTGKLQFPKDNVAKIMVDCVQKLHQSTSLEKVMLVAYDKDADMIAAFQNALKSAGSTNVSSEQKKTRRAPPLGTSVEGEEDLFFKLGDVELEIKYGDITKESADAIVVLGNESIDLLGAVGNAIKKAEGEEFKKRVLSIASQRKGTTELIQTSELPSKYLAHIVPTSESCDGLKSATKGMFKKCNKNKLKSVSIPAIGTGVIGKSPEESARLILHSIAELSIDKKVANIEKVNIVLFDERLVSKFKKSLREVAAGPQNPKDNEGVIAWIKGHFTMLVKSLFSRNEENDEVADSTSHVSNAASRDSPLTPVIFTVYFSNEKRVVNEVQEKIKKVLDDHITSANVQKESFKNLPLYIFEKIKLFARQQDVLVDLDRNAGRIRLSGYHKDLASVLEFCHDVAAQKFEDDQRREKEQMVAKYVQWKEKQKDGSLCDYDPVLNYQIETQFKEKNNDPQIEVVEGDTVNIYKLDFSNKEEMKVVSICGKEERIIIREELAAFASHGVNNLPKNWDPMPKDSSGLEVKVHCVQLQPNSQEFVNVSAKFTSSSGGQIYNIVKIERIQNPQLYKSYLAKRESMEKTAGQDNVRELELYHGTNPNSVVEINENGFNRSFAGVNGTAYGVGVYFAKDASYSVGYATRSGSLPRCMYLAKVLAGKYTGGNPSYKVAPKGYDTVVDNPNSPRIHVVFYDNQCYPEYLLHFT